jgi:AraC family transcriptional regulator
MLDQLAPAPPARLDVSPRLCPRVEQFRAPAGPISVQAAADHRLRIHTGPPARGRCGRSTFVSTRGHIDLLPAGVQEDWHGEDPTESLVVSVPSPVFERAAAELGSAQHGFAARCMLRDPHIEHIAWALEAERNAGSPSGLLYAESLGLALAAHLLATYANTSAPHRPVSRALSTRERQRVTAHIEAHLDQPLTLSVLAATLGMSASHFKALFRRSMGLPVHEYIVQRRVERARALLLEARLPAAEIALATGFAHQSHMARQMRRVLGLTPTALLRAAQV